MERTGERLALARRALGTLEELVSVPPASPLVRDAAIQRFEYTFEATWKAARVYLREVEGLEIGSPKGVVRLSLQAGVLDEVDARRMPLTSPGAAQDTEDRSGVGYGLRVGRQTTIMQCCCGDAC
jgi:hypothetical protein